MVDRTSILFVKFPLCNSSILFHKTFFGLLLDNRGLFLSNWISSFQSLSVYLAPLTLKTADSEKLYYGFLVIMISQIDCPDY